MRLIRGGRPFVCSCWGRAQQEGGKQKSQDVAAELEAAQSYLLARLAESPAAHRLPALALVQDGAGGGRCGRAGRVLALPQVAAGERQGDEAGQGVPEPLGPHMPTCPPLDHRPLAVAGPASRCQARPAPPRAPQAAHKAQLQDALAAATTDEEQLAALQRELAAARQAAASRPQPAANGDAVAAAEALRAQLAAAQVNAAAAQQQLAAAAAAHSEQRARAEAATAAAESAQRAAAQRGEEAEGLQRRQLALEAELARARSAADATQAAAAALREQLEGEAAERAAARDAELQARKRLAEAEVALADEAMRRELEVRRGGVGVWGALHIGGHFLAGGHWQMGIAQRFLEDVG